VNEIKDIEDYKRRLNEKERLIIFKIFDEYSKKELSFSIKNNITHERATTLFTKEPLTISWIRNFDNKSIFFDIGANIGVYSLYAALIKDIKVISFEPESKNFQTLIENILINKLSSKISAYPIGISDKTEFSNLYISQFTFGGSHHSIGEYPTNLQTSEPIKTDVKQGIFTTSLNDFLVKWDMEIPNYIKVDVDGIEHKIFDQADKILGNKNLKSILVEINEKRKEDKLILDKLLKYDFKIDYKQMNNVKKNIQFNKDYVEYLFCR